MIHIIFGASATASLKYTFNHEHHRIIGFPIDFSVGPIRNIHQENGMERYVAWFHSTFSKMWADLDHNETVLEHSFRELANIKDDEEITIWTCENASEQIGLRIICYLLQDKQINLRYVNTFDAMEETMKDEAAQVSIRHTGECNGKQLAYFYKMYKKSMSPEMRMTYEKEGEHLLDSSSVVRSLVRGRIVEEEATRDDELILECARRIHRECEDREFVYVARVIGEVIGHAEQPISDAWVEYRIRTLIESNKIAYQGELFSKKMYEIKLLE